MHSEHELGHHFLTTFWIFQLVFAAPISAALAISAVVRLLNTHGPLYDFITHLCTSILMAAIVFIILIQRKIGLEETSKNLTWRFELSKSIIATDLWIWLMLDAAFRPQEEYSFYGRSTRVAAASTACILLL